MSKFITLLYIIGAIFIGLIVVKVAFKVAIWGAMLALVVFFGLIGYLISLLFRRK